MPSNQWWVIIWGRRTPSRWVPGHHSADLAKNDRRVCVAVGWRGHPWWSRVGACAKVRQWYWPQGSRFYINPTDLLLMMNEDSDLNLGRVLSSRCKLPQFAPLPGNVSTVCSATICSTWAKLVYHANYRFLSQICPSPLTPCNLTKDYFILAYSCESDFHRRIYTQSAESEMAASRHHRLGEQMCSCPSSFSYMWYVYTHVYVYVYMYIYIKWISIPTPLQKLSFGEFFSVSRDQPFEAGLNLKLTARDPICP